MKDRRADSTRGRWLELALCWAVLSAGCNAAFDIHEGTPRRLCADPLTIDDLEDGDGTICPSDGRNAGWYDFGDGSDGQIDPPPSPLSVFTPTKILDGSHGTSQYAARFNGSGFTSWGARMGLALKLGHGTETQAYDVSNQGGIVFWMKSSVPVSVEFPTLETATFDRGGACTDTSTASNCDNHFFFQVPVPVPEWQQFFVPFSALAQRPGGNAVWNPRHLLNIQFGVLAGATFDVWIDDLAFYDCAAPNCRPTCVDPDFPISCPTMNGLRASCRPIGTECAAVATWCANHLTIDDMEDADAWICSSEGRRGTWSTNGFDGTTHVEPGAARDFKQTLIPGGRGASHRAARMNGTGIVGLARMGVDFAATDAGDVDYDGSRYDGIRFWLKSDVPVIVGFTSPETLPVSENGTCDQSPPQENCRHHFEFVTAATGGEWVDYKVPFSALRQAVDHNAPPATVPSTATWDAHHLRAMAFLTTSPNFDVWVDDLAFYNCGVELCAPTCTGDTVPCAASGARPAGCWPAGTDCASLPAVAP